MLQNHLIQLHKIILIKPNHNMNLQEVITSLLDIVKTMIVKTLIKEFQYEFIKHLKRIQIYTTYKMKAMDSLHIIEIHIIKILLHNLQ